DINQIGLIPCIWKKGAPPCHACYLVQHGAPPSLRHIGIGRLLSNAYCIDQNIRFLGLLSKRSECISAVVVLSIRYHENCLLRVPSAFKLVDREMHGIEKCCSPVRHNLLQPPDNMIG